MINVYGIKNCDKCASLKKWLKKNEINCIGAGAKFLSGLDSNFLVLSCGSGTACVGYENEISTHLGGSGLGGGTIRGLCKFCLLYTSPSPRDVEESRMPSSA